MPDKRIPRTEARRINRAAYARPDQASQQTNLRSVFLQWVRELEPAVLETLAGEPFEHMLMLHWRIMQGEIPPLFVPELDGPPFGAWAAHWHLEATWCVQVALETVERWVKRAFTEPGYHPARDRERDWRYPIEWIEEPFGAEELDFTPALPHYTPWAQDRWKAAEHIREAFERQLREYLTNMELRCAQAGMVPVRRVRTEAHFAWLVRYQIRGERCEQLAATHADQQRPERTSKGKPRKRDPEQFDPETVYGAIRDLAAVIALPPRERPPADRRK
jgi:hypothetical protein